MRMARWGAAAAAALTTCVPFVAEAATSPSTQTATSSTGSATTPTTAPGSATPAGTASSKVQTAVTGATAPKTAPAPQPTSSKPTQPTAQQSTQQSTVTQPAPPGSSEAYAAQVGDVAAISHTKASASSSGESATADPLELGGNPPAAAFGGTESGNSDGSNSGALLDTGKQPFGRLALTPWSTTNSHSASGNSASGLADIVWLDLGDPSTQQSASLRVLQSESNAQWTPDASTGNASADGAILDLGGPNGLAVDVLHSETSSSGAGSSYLLSINGNQIGTSGQAGGKCSVTLPGVLSLDCLTASGGTGTTGVLSSAAGVASATVGPATSGLTAALIQSKGTSAKAPAAVTPAATSPASGAPATAPAAAAPAASAPAAAAPASAAPAASSRLPFTGANVGFLVGAALLLGGAGAGIVLVSRRPRAAARR